MCRWPRDVPVAVAATGASAHERALVARALEAIAAGVPGVALGLLPPTAAEAALTVRFESLDDAALASGGSGDAIADCRVDDPLGEGRLPDRLSARLESASVRVARERLDWRGQRVVLDDAELVGALLHELAHALGFAGHAPDGNTILRSAPSEARLRARPVLRGEPLRDRTLEALYALPNGLVLRRDRLPAGAAATLKVFAGLAAEAGMGAPRSRAGQASAEVWWPAADGPRWALRASRRGEPWPEGFTLIANAAARRALRERAAP